MMIVRSTWMSIVASILAAVIVCAQDPTPLPTPRTLPDAKDKADSPKQTEDAKPSELTLIDVLKSVEEHFPLLLAVEQERQITAGRQISAEGAFDNVIKSRYGHAPENNSFPNMTYNFGIEQATGWGGLSYYAGYRISTGTFPDYYGYLFTGDGGEFRGGLALPLCRDGAIDRRRATRAQAGIDRMIAEPVIRRQRLDAFRAGGRAYWAWVAAGRRLDIARKLLTVAEQRDQALKIRVERGAIAAIERTDNLQTVADRKGRVTTAERRFQEATYILSLYLRDEAGKPILANSDCVPSAFPELTPYDVTCTDANIASALENRPEILRLRLARERLQVDLRLADNQTMPGLNALVNAAQDIGAGKKDLDRTTLELALALDLPIQRRDARGRIVAAQGQILQLAAQERFAGDQIAAEVRDTLSAIDRAVELHRQASERVRYASQVEEGERRKLLLGQSSILTLNLRELATFDASLTVIDAEFEYFRAVVDYRAAMGMDGIGNP